MKKPVFALLTVALLASCGFEPMYGTAFQSGSEKADIQAELSQVAISNIPDRSGQYLRNALIDKFYQNSRPASPKYTLVVGAIQESIIDLDITKNSNATRGQMRLSTTLTLTDNVTGESVLQRPITSVASYNILTSEFATRVSENNTRKNALDDLAGQIELQIGLYLKR